MPSQDDLRVENWWHHRNMDDRQRAADMLDLQEGRGRVPVLEGGAPSEGLGRGATASPSSAPRPSPHRPSYGVMRYLLSQGYDCVPINPNVSEVHGQRAFPTLEDAVAAGGPFDIVDVFRRSDALSRWHARRWRQAQARCGCSSVWSTGRRRASPTMPGCRS